MPKDPKIISDLWKEAWKGQNAWTNGAHVARDAVNSGPKAAGVGGVVNTLINWLLGN
jgi:hypothetical protein